MPPDEAYEERGEITPLITQGAEVVDNLKLSALDRLLPEYSLRRKSVEYIGATIGTILVADALAGASIHRIMPFTRALLERIIN